MGTKIHGLISELTTSLGGNYPKVPFAEGIDVDAITEGDDNPFFIVLPVGQVSVSRNDRVYRREAVESIKEAVVNRRIGGILGHLKDDARPYEFNIPVIHWLGAVFEGDTLWAKGYIPKTQPDLREYMRISMRSKAEVGTSIYGTAEVEDDGRVTNLWVETIDIAHPDRVGVTRAAEIPLVTSETAKEPVQEGQEFRFRIRRGIYRKITDQPDWDEIVARIADKCGMTMGQLWDMMDSTEPIPDKILQVFSDVLNIPLEELRQLSAINPDPNNETSSESEATGETNMGNDTNPKPTGEAAPDTATQIAELERKHTESIREMQLKLTAAENANRDFAKMKSLLSIGENEDAILRAMGIAAEVGNLRKENGELLEATIKAEVAAKVTVESVRPVVEAMVKDQKPARRVDVTTALEGVLAKPEIKTLLMHSVSEIQGPPQTRPVVPSASPIEDEMRTIIPGVN